MSNSKSIFYIDPFSKVIFRVSKNNFEKVESYTTKSYVGSRVSFEDVITHSFKINSSISKEDLELQVELKMYEDAGLRTDQSYKISYIEKKLDYEDSSIIEAFAINTSKIKDRLTPVLKNNYLDFLALPNLSFKTLYTNKILSPKQDIFVYIAENEAFLSIYKDGRYLASTTLMTLEALCKKASLGIEEVKDILVNKGLNQENYLPGEMDVYEEISSFFSEMFSKLNNMAIYNRSIFGFENIDRIFLDLCDNRVKGLREFAKNLGFEDTKFHDFNLFRQKERENLFEKIVASYIYDKYVNQDNSFNLSFYEKPIPWYKKESGKFFIYSFLMVALFGAYPLYLNINMSKKEDIKAELEQKLRKAKDQSRDIKEKILQYKLKIRKLENLKKQDDVKLSNIGKSVDELINMKTDNKKNSLLIVKINEYLKKYQLSLKSFEQKGNNIVLEIIAPYDKRDQIASFMKDLTNDGFVEVSTNEIKLDQNFYISKIEIAK